MSDSGSTQSCSAVDAFDLPEWLGVDPVTWSAVGPLRHGIVPGMLHSDTSDIELPCDLMAGDVADPIAVVDEATRVLIHQAWRHGQVHVVRRDARLTLGAPGVDFTAPRVLDVVGRLAKAVGAPPDHFSVRLRVARDGSGWDRGG
ncbi:hypothetical protein F0U44_19870 [Nocardioides humilatus]|uniref:Uncharacterized protein n=1 Tax=Nocardioides humilatus TaxID=2607660 RepID=A0A5B1L5V4_9ACTN|nr:hypothetical protein [Nocardioides humilatus]KAA1415895.1 hypothetical protein F0U44_19870 [Nocardioides humilatus]